MHIFFVHNVNKIDGSYEYWNSQNEIFIQPLNLVPSNTFYHVNGAIEEEREKGLEFGGRGRRGKEGDKGRADKERKIVNIKGGEREKERKYMYKRER